jgi:hypothetical protein
MAPCRITLEEFGGHKTRSESCQGPLAELVRYCVISFTRTLPSGSISQDRNGKQEPRGKLELAMRRDNANLPPGENQPESPLERKRRVERECLCWRCAHRTAVD